MAKDPEKTEDPTAKRINEAREDGNVLNSPDITSVVMLIGTAIILSSSIHRFGAGYYECLNRVLNHFTSNESWNLETLREGAYFGGYLFINAKMNVFLSGLST